MPQKIESCPLIATLKNGNLFLFNHDAIVEGLFITELTVESIAQISAELFLKGIDVTSLSVDEARMNYKWIEVL